MLSAALGVTGAITVGSVLSSVGSSGLLTVSSGANYSSSKPMLRVLEHRLDLEMLW